MDVRYTGARISTVDVVEINSITAKAFFDAYVVPRKPCIITGQLPQSAFSTWTLEHLRAQAGNTLVEVEHREVWPCVHW